MAAESKAITFTSVIYLFFYFVSTDERPPTGFQPNLANGVDLQMPLKVWGLPK